MPFNRDNNRARLTRGHGAQLRVAQFRVIERHMLFALAEFRDDRLELFLDVLLTVAVEQMADRPRRKSGLNKKRLVELIRRGVFYFRVIQWSPSSDLSPSRKRLA